jgi:DNA-binding MltR family transcriptional regulator
MVSRRDSLRKLDTKLKTLAKSVPEGEGGELFNILFRSVDPSEQLGAFLSRTIALVSTAFLEHALEKAILTHMPKDIEPATRKELFEGESGPLGTFSSKIILARGLGIVDKKEREDLDTIRIIRNSFAHSMTHFEFSNAAVERLCIALNFGDSPFARKKDAKSRFVLAVAILFERLINYSPQKH